MDGFIDFQQALLKRLERGFRVEVVIGDPWTGEGSQHVHLLQPALQRGRFHGVAVIGMEDQWWLVALGAAKALGAVVALPETGLLHQFSAI